MHAIIAAFMGSALAGECPEGDPLDATNAQVTEALDAAETMFPTDADRFVKLMGPVRVTAGCLSEPIDIAVAARYHRLYALERDPAGKFGLDSTLVAGSLKAARALDSAYEFPPALLADSHPLRVAYGKLPPELPAVQRVPAPREGTLLFDGTASLDRPLGVATFYQRTDATGAIVESTYLATGTALPAYALDPVKRRRLSMGAIASGVVAASLYTGALVTEAHFNDPERAATLEQLHAVKDSNNALFGASIGFGITAGGLGLAAFLVGAR